MIFFFLFFLNDTAPTEIYTYGHTLSLHDALPICRRTLFLGLRQRHPALDHLEGAPGLRRRVVEALRMGDAAAGGHPVHLAGANSLLGAEAVAVHEPAVEQKIGRAHV